jgi:hypothetical protein
MLNYGPFGFDRTEASVAQLVEQFIRNDQVIGSNPIAGSIFLPLSQR